VILLLLLVIAMHGGLVRFKFRILLLATYINYCAEQGPCLISWSDDNDIKGKDVLHEIVKSEAYSEKDFKKAVKIFGKKWYVKLTHCIPILK
jgi:hypothetical protein